MGLFVRDGFDPDAWVYIQAVEAADGQTLEVGVRRAIGRFVRGCKDDGIWTAIKASCILAGARTLSGALVPLVGSAPTNNGFVSGDYNRITGLKGDGSTKYLDSNRNNNADPQNSKHITVYATELATNVNLAVYMNAGSGASARSHILRDSTDTVGLYKLNDSSNSTSTISTGFIGLDRSSSTSYVARASSSNTTFNVNSSSPISENIGVFGSATGSTIPPRGNPRLSFYSIGESLDLALLDTRVSQLMTAINSALS